MKRLMKNATVKSRQSRRPKTSVSPSDWWLVSPWHSRRTGNQLKNSKWQTETYEERQLTEDDYVFRRNGFQLPMTPSTFTWRFKLILKKHGLPEKLNVHSLRHSNASLLIANGTDVATVAGLLGHSQPSTTLDIYTHAFDKNKKAASTELHQGLEI